MKTAKWHGLGWENPIWELVRYYLSITKNGERDAFVQTLKAENAAKVGKVELQLEGEVASQLVEYLDLERRCGRPRTNCSERKVRPRHTARRCSMSFQRLPKPRIRSTTSLRKQWC
jgi:hypothetical protein